MLFTLRTNVNSATASVEVDGTLTCNTSSGFPAIFTAADDNTVGETIYYSTGSPAGNFYANPAIYTPGSVSLSNVRISYAEQAVWVMSGNLALSDSEVTACQAMAVLGAGGYGSGMTVTCNNCLCDAPYYGIFVYDNSSGGDHYNLNNCTLNNVYYLVAGQNSYNYNQGNAVNCVFAGGYMNVTGLCTWSGSHNGFYYAGTPFGSPATSTTAPPFHTSGGDGFYLAADLPFRNVGVGTPTISPTLLADLHARTTYAPQDGGSPDNDPPDLGYHYPIQDSDNDGLPDWWEMQYFGNLSKNGDSLDISGNKLLYDYQHVLDPNIYNFIITITSPTVSTVSAPMIQLQGFANQNLSSLTFDVQNAAGTLANQTGYVTSRSWDPNLLAFRTSYFQCYDVALAQGLNQITVHATDTTGHTTTANVNFTLNNSGATTPVVSTVWPPAGAKIGGNQVTLQGTLNDPTATVSATVVDADGNTRVVAGVVERNGNFWVDNLPLGSGANTVTLTAVNAVDNSKVNVTSFTLTGNDVGLTMDTLDQFNQTTVDVNGGIGDGSYSVTVNGMAANITADGVDSTWSATGVPVSLTGTADFYMEVRDGSGNLIAVQYFHQPQPAKVGLMNYSDNVTTPVGTQVINWNWLSGGDDKEDNIYGDHEDLSFPPGDAGAGQLQDSPYFNSVGLTHGSFVGRVTGVIDTHFMIEPSSGKAVPGAMNSYIVKAQVQGYYYDNGVYYLSPVDPQTVQIRGTMMTPINNPDGSVWGEAVVTVPAGANADVTPIVPVNTYSYYSFNNIFIDEINLQLAVDANRDGNITFDAPYQVNPDKTSSSNPYRFWVNNDNDGNDPDIGDYDDLEPNPATGSDANNTFISCTRDLEDYTRLWINTAGITTELQDGTFLLALEWKVTPPEDPQIRIFPAVENDGGSLYLTTTDKAQQQIAGTYGNAIVDRSGQKKVTSSAKFVFQPSFWSNLSAGQPVAHLLFDAVSRGSGQLIISIYKNDGVTKLAESPQPLYLKLQDVKEMYERWTVGSDPNSAPLTTASVVPSTFSYDSTIPAENNYILFVHGWNLEQWEKDAFAETAFKRLYWQGYKGHFGAFQWPTGYGFGGGAWDVIADSRNFDNSEANAWASAAGLLGKLTDLNATYPNHVYLLAHSMGNVVAGEALKLARSSQMVNTYVAAQGAIAAHTYDPSCAPHSFYYLGINQFSGTPNRYAEYSTDGAPCYFNGIIGAGTFVNFYNLNDYALGKWVIDQDLKPDHGGLAYPGYYYDPPPTSHPSGFYKIVGSDPSIDLLFPANTYVIFAYCDEARSFALGATANVNRFSPQNLPGLWPDDTSTTDPNQKYSAHKWHSAEFNFDNMQQGAFWKNLMSQFGLPTN